MRIADKLQLLNELADEYAESKGEEIRLTHFRKSQLAILKKQYLADNPKWSDVRCENNARASDEYLEVLKGLSIATINKEKAFWHLKNEHAVIGLHQTLQADKRALLNKENQFT